MVVLAEMTKFWSLSFITLLCISGTCCALRHGSHPRREHAQSHVASRSPRLHLQRLAQRIAARLARQTELVKASQQAANTAAMAKPMGASSQQHVHPVHTSSTAVALQGFRDLELPALQQVVACTHSNVTQIKCFLSETGYLTGLAFEDGAGISSPAICSAARQVDGGLLQPDEAIVDILTCRDKQQRGYVYMEFLTNATRQYPATCGYGGRSNSPASDSSAGQQTGNTPGVVASDCELLSHAHSQVATAGAAIHMQPASHHAWNLSLPYPLSGLKASCNSQGHIVSLSNPCWQPAAATSPPVLRQAVLLQVKARRKEQQRCRKGVCADEGAKQGAVGSVETVLQQALTTHQFTNFELASTVTSCLPCSARTTSTTWYMTVAIQATGQKDLLAVLGDKSSKEAIELPGVKVFIMGVKPAVQ